MSTLVRSTLKATDNNPRTSTGKFQFTDSNVFGARLYSAPGEDIVAGFEEFGIRTEGVD